MPSVSKHDAAERLAKGVEKAQPSHLVEIEAELFPERSVAASLAAEEIARHIRRGLEPEEIVNLWNVVFPADHNVWYDEEAKAIRYNEEMAGSAD